ncbi:ABC transporter substrate-binding protein [Aquamicrobium defluvii]|uniref:ABC transporter substrate-binding protein n=1 Tax=Aquamicrobium defluvii TaxID=69279 RepID=A0A011UT80_9HYPH|nr:ABC transporter substrate-binding protein [Aquamicrobium defluvii]EXL09446.1 ABC transporter substrate-binding protein [Aquamicrobium defluvii]EZQ13638.1 ABC transporter substrate-binding protein [Halopseudomonas bauzanensis]
MKSFALLAVAGLLSTLAATAGAQAAEYGKCEPKGERGSISLETIAADTLTVATVLPNPGWYNGISPEKIEDGFEYCMGAEIAHRAGLDKVRLVNMAWDQYISGTASNYDIGIAGTTITEARKQVFDFSQPYFSSNLGVAVKKGADVSAENIRSKRIGVLQGNMGSDWVIGTLKPDQQPSLYQSQPDMVTALIAGQVDAIVSDATLVLSATNGTNGMIEVIGQFELDQGYGIVLPKGSANAAVVDQAVAAFREDGTLADLSARYLAPLFGVDPASVPVWTLK